jgi:hypothetical protein
MLRKQAQEWPFVRGAVQQPQLPLAVQPTNNTIAVPLASYVVRSAASIRPQVTHNRDLFRHHGPVFPGQNVNSKARLYAVPLTQTT